MLHSSPREGLGQELGNNIEYNLAKFIYIADVRGEATNSGLGGGGGRFKSGPFLYRKYKRGIEESNLSSSC